MKTQKKYVYDLITRITHAGIGLSTLLLFGTAQMAKIFYENGQVTEILWSIHIYLGYVLSAFLMLRFIWFFKGPHYSRLTHFFKLRECFEHVKMMIRTKKIKSIPWGWGHHPLAAFVYFLVYIKLTLLVITGLFLARIEMDFGPLPEKFFDDMKLYDFFIFPHDAASLFIIIFTGIHLVSLYYHQIKDKVPVFISMWTGYQYKQAPDGENTNECD